MEKTESVVAVFPDHTSAETAVKALMGAGFDVKNLSLIGKGFHTEEKVVGFYNVGDRMRFWGSRGAFWGGFWGLFFGGLLLTVPVIGHVVVLGYLAATAISAIEGAVVVGGVSALGAAFYSIGIPKDSVVRFENDVKADGFLVMAHGTNRDIERAKSLLETTHPSRIDMHPAGEVNERSQRLVDAVS